MLSFTIGSKVYTFFFEGLNVIMTTTPVDGTYNIFQIIDMCSRQDVTLFAYLVMLLVLIALIWSANCIGHLIEDAANYCYEKKLEKEEEF